MYSKEVKKLLLIEDDPSIRFVVSKIVSDMGYEVVSPVSYDYGLSLLIHKQFKIVVIESSPMKRPIFNKKLLDDSKKVLNENSFISVIIFILKNLLKIPEFIFISKGNPQKDIDFAIDQGAVDFIQIPVKMENNGNVSYPEKIKKRLSNAIKRAVSIVDGSLFKSLDLEGFVCESWTMKRVLLQLFTVLHNEENVFISGKHGTGKSSLARIIHKNSRRKDESFVFWDIKPWKLIARSENIAIGTNSFSLPLLFSDWKKKYKRYSLEGLSLKRLFCEFVLLISWYKFNIDELYDDFFDNFHYTQPHFDDLLTFIPYQKYFPKNGIINFHHLENFDKERLISLSRDIWRNDAKGKPYRYIFSLLDDPIYFYELKDISAYLFADCIIRLPPLVDRKEDIASITEIELNTMCKYRFNAGVTMSSDFVWTLENYPWWGNLFELRNVLKYAVSQIGTDEIFEVTHLPKHLHKFSSQRQMLDSSIFDLDSIESTIKLLDAPSKQLSIEDVSAKGKADKQDHINTVHNSQPIANSDTKTQQYDHKPDSNRPLLFFYKDRNLWRIGTKFHNALVKDSKGLRFLFFLIMYPNEYFSSLTVYHKGAEIDPNVKRKYVVDATRNKRVLKLREASVNELKKFKKKLSSEEAKSDDLEAESTRKELLFEVIKTLEDKDIRDDKSRIAVTKGIRRAIADITKEVPEMMKYLNKQTVKTGYSMSYRPILYYTPEWIQDKDKVPQENL